ncbi:holin [Escherichia phage UPEC07]|nr:holin [Escherichia phage UPEC07]
MEPKVGISIPDLLFGLLDRIFKDNATGKVVFSRVLVIVLLFLMVVIWYKGDAILDAYRDASYASYTEMIRQDQDNRFKIAAIEQIQIVHSSSGADFTAIYSFRPTNLNYFVDMVGYEGILPDTVDEKNLGGFPIDKTSAEYLAGVNGNYFESSTESVFLPTKKKSSFSYMFSCPFFNLENVYAGTVSLYWYKQKPILGFDRLSAMCGQAGRTLGRTR